LLTPRTPYFPYGTQEEGSKRFAKACINRLFSVDKELFYYSLSLFLSAIIINRKEMFCQGAENEIQNFTHFLCKNFGRMENLYIDISKYLLYDRSKKES
jgi:hypothetical protein